MGLHSEKLPNLLFFSETPPLASLHLNLLHNLYILIKCYLVAGLSLATLGVSKFQEIAPADDEGRDEEV